MHGTSQHWTSSTHSSTVTKTTLNLNSLYATNAQNRTKKSVQELNVKHKTNKSFRDKIQSLCQSVKSLDGIQILARKFSKSEVRLKPVRSRKHFTTYSACTPWLFTIASSICWNINGWLQIFLSCMIVFIKIFVPPRPCSRKRIRNNHCSAFQSMCYVCRIKIKEASQRNDTKSGIQAKIN